MRKPFSQWLSEQLSDRDMRPADLVRASGLDSAVISNLMNEKRKPGPRTIKAIAKALQISEEEVYQAAGMLKLGEDDDPAIRAVVTILRDMRPDDVLDVLEYVRLQSRLKKKDIPRRPHKRKIVDT